MTLSSYFIGISAGQLLYGPLLDRFGRKTTFIGLLVYILASFGCVYVTDIDTIILRFIQAIGSCAAAVASVSMVRDLFPVKRFQGIFFTNVGCGTISILLTVGGLCKYYMAGIRYFHLDVCRIVILIAAQIGLPNSYDLTILYR
jgi:DHA1 family bicyclomycin/chloramphenicol resistance-like MFS transporter